MVSLQDHLHLPRTVGHLVDNDALQMALLEACLLLFGVVEDATPSGDSVTASAFELVQSGVSV